MSHADGCPSSLIITSKIRKPNSPIRYRPPATIARPSTPLISPAIARDLVRRPVVGDSTSSASVAVGVNVVGRLIASPSS